MTTNSTPMMSSVQRSSGITIPQRSNSGEAQSLVDIHGNETGDTGLVHRHTHELRRELHRRLVVSNEDELHPLRHLSHDIAESPHIVLIERRIHLIQKTERGWIEVENRKYQRHRGQGLLTTGQQVNGAVLLTGRTRHDGHARREDVIADQFQVGMSPTEQPRKLLLHAGIDLLKG